MNVTPPAPAENRGIHQNKKSADLEYSLALKTR
jgi:hypothetical protein